MTVIFGVCNADLTTERCFKLEALNLAEFLHERGVRTVVLQSVPAEGPVKPYAHELGIKYRLQDLMNLEEKDGSDAVHRLIAEA